MNTDALLDRRIIDGPSMQPPVLCIRDPIYTSTLQIHYSLCQSSYRDKYSLAWDWLAIRGMVSGKASAISAYFDVEFDFTTVVVPDTRNSLGPVDEWDAQL